jgi:hypothetical protein
MHTRRLASFLLGAWLLGCLFAAFIATQNFQNVDRILNNPPGPVAKDIEDLGSDITRLLLKFQASEMNRFLYDTWGVAQIGLGAAFLCAVLFTAHRSKYLVIVSAAMLLITIIQNTYITASLVALGRAFDFLPAAAASKERESFQGFQMMYTTVEVLKVLLGLSLAGRLLFDRYGWKQKLLPAAPRRMERRRKSGSRSGSAAGQSGADTATAGGNGGAAGTDTATIDTATVQAVKRDAVNKPDDSHVDG